MICKQCGNVMGDNDNNCGTCGAPAQAPQQGAPVQPQQQPPVQQWQAPQGQPQQPPQQQWQAPQGQPQQQAPQQQWQAPQGQPQQQAPQWQQPQGGQQQWQAPQGQPQQQWQQPQGGQPQWNQPQGQGGQFKMPGFLAGKSNAFLMNAGAAVLTLLFMLLPWMKISVLGYSESVGFFKLAFNLGDLDLDGNVWAILYIIGWLAGFALLGYFLFRLFTNYRNNFQQNMLLATIGFGCAGGAAILIQILVLAIKAEAKKALGDYGDYSSLLGDVIKTQFWLYLVIIIAAAAIFYTIPQLKKEVASGR